MPSVHNFFFLFVSSHLFRWINLKPYQQPPSLSILPQNKATRDKQRPLGHGSGLNGRKYHKVCEWINLAESGTNPESFSPPTLYTHTRPTFSLCVCVCVLASISRSEFTYNSPRVFVLGNKAAGQWRIVCVSKCVFYSLRNVIVWSYCGQRRSIVARLGQRCCKRG